MKKNMKKKKTTLEISSLLSTNWPPSSWVHDGHPISHTARGVARKNVVVLALHHHLTMI
jgi:hypothetical protein